VRNGGRGPVAGRVSKAVKKYPKQTTNKNKKEKKRKKKSEREP